MKIEGVVSIYKRSIDYEIFEDGVLVFARSASWNRTGQKLAAAAEHNRRMDDYRKAGYDCSEQVIRLDY